MAGDEAPRLGRKNEDIAAQVKALPRELAAVNVERVIEATEGFTGADMKRLIDDAKGLYAFDRAEAAPIREAHAYFIEAAAAVRDNKQRYELAESAAQARPRAATLPGFFFGHPSIPDDN